MNTLRIIKNQKTKNGTFADYVENINLGDSYYLYCKGTDVFNDIIAEAVDGFEKVLRYVLVSEKGTKFLITNNINEDGGSDFYYIVSDNGKTFERLT